MLSSSRRDFLRHASLAVGAGVLTKLPAAGRWGALPADYLPEPDEAMLRQLASVAMDEAKRVGASFADIRLSFARAIELDAAAYVQGGKMPPVWPLVSVENGFGVRVIVNGSWGFANGLIFTAESVAEAVQVAAASARAHQPRHRTAIELAPVPKVENGVWEMKIEKDPFAVSFLEQREWAEAAFAQLEGMPGITDAKLLLRWRRCVSAFASTEGSTILQRMVLAVPSASVVAMTNPDEWSTRVQAPVEGFRVGQYGYEAFAPETLATRVREAAERAIARSKATVGSTNFEVGRYDLVLSPRAVGDLLLGTIARALDMSFAIGYFANGAGVSFAAPPKDVVGKLQVASPLVTVHGDRTQPNGAATVAWDEEGVKPERYTFVKHGVVTDYHTDRQTAPLLGDWYRSRGEPVRAHGCMRGSGDSLPEVALPNITMDEGAGATTGDDLIAGTRRGLYIETLYPASDHQILNTQGLTSRSAVRAITNGKLGGHVKNMALQFITPQLWKSVDAIGGEASARTFLMVTDDSALTDPLQVFPFSTVRTVPMHVKNVNVLNTGRTA